MWCGRWRCGVCRGCARAHIRTVNVTVPRATESGTYVVEWACFCVHALIFKNRVSKAQSQVTVVDLTQPTRSRLVLCESTQPRRRRVKACTVVSLLCRLGVALLLSR